ncbi:MAG: hypothetical protein ACTSRX_06635 [Promethearchaeota archaeon]
MKKIKSFSIILMMLLSALSVAFIPSSSGSVSTELPDYIPMDIGPDFFTDDVDLNLELLGSPSSSNSMGPKSAAIAEGDFVVGLAYDSGGLFATWYQCRAVGPLAEVWVQANLAFPEGDPRETPVITDEQVDYLLEEFETNIYEKTTNAFGIPNDHDGSEAVMETWGPPYGGYYDEENRNIIMVSNVRDENYYDPEYPYYIAGFYWGSEYEYYMDRNVITIDSHDWENRVGPNDVHPYMYESTIAHEYQHLIHADYNPGDDTFMNEACSLYAEPLCGYPISWSQVDRFLETPDNSLTEWEDQGGRNVLADYGSSFLWAMYLADHYGGDAFISHFVQSGLPGVTGINAALEFFGYEEDFDDVYHDWRIANLVQADSGKYGYSNLDFSKAGNTLKLYEAGTAPFDWTKGTDFGTTVSLDGDDTGIAKIGPYGTDYIKYDSHKRPTWNRLYIDGQDVTYLYDADQWELIDNVWYSGDHDLMNAIIADEVYVDPSDPTLYLTSSWEIEDYWDFGFVQVSTDDGITWTSLANEYTTSDYADGAHPDVVANLPGITEYIGGVEVVMEFDLTTYADQEVLIGFRYVTDWMFTWGFGGWAISDADVGETDLDLEVFYQPYPIEFMINLVAVKEMSWGNRIEVMEVSLNDLTNEGTLGQYNAWMDYFVIIVSPLFDKGLVDYSFEVASIKPGKNM